MKLSPIQGAPVPILVSTPAAQGDDPAGTPSGDTMDSTGGSHR